MMKFRKLRILEAEQGQNLIEYALLLGFIALMATSVYIAAGGSTHDVWSVSSSQLAAANAVASGQQASAATAAPTSPGESGDSNPPAGGDQGSGDRDHDHHWR